MAASYPPLLAQGITDGDTFAPFDLYAGSGPWNTSAMQAADGVAIEQFAVLTADASGRLIPLAQAGDYATGSIVVGGNPVSTNTVSVNGNALTFVVASPGANDCVIGTSTQVTADNIRAAINANPTRYNVTASGTGTTVTLTANVAGTAGNSIALAEGVTDALFTVSGATLSGANAAEDVPSGNAFAIAAQPVPASTPGGWVPIFLSGGFNHEALVWPAGMATLAARKLAFAGTPIYPQQLL